MRSQQKCWFRRNIHFAQCELGQQGQESSQFDMYTKKL